MGRWDAVAKVVNDRMAERQISQRELAEKAQIGVSTLRSIQAGEDRERSRTTLGALSRALGFPEDHLLKVSQGGAAVPSSSDPTLESLQEEIAELRQRVQSIESRLDS